MPAASKAPLVRIQTVEAPLRWFATLLLATVLAVALAACSDDPSGSGESDIERQQATEPKGTPAASSASERGAPLPEATVAPEEAAGASAQRANCYSTFDSKDICYAIQEGDIETVRDLVEAGADLNAVDESGESRLGSAVLSVEPNTEIIRILIDAGADVNVETLFHGSVLSAAIATLGEKFELADHVSVVKMLVNAGVLWRSTGQHLQWGQWAHRPHLRRPAPASSPLTKGQRCAQMTGADPFENVS